MKQRRDGLLPRMQAITRKKGVYYRYITRDNKHVGLGYDLNSAIKRVLELNGKATDIGKISKLWEIYSNSPEFLKLAPTTQSEYRQCAKPILKIFGDVYAGHIKAPWIYRYITIERADAPVRANREKSLLSNLIDLAIRRGEAEFNPCKQVRRNEEQPRTESPSKGDFEGCMTWLKDQGGRRLAIAQMAQRGGMPYTSNGFKGMWGRLKREAKAAGIEFNATFHDLRAYYATAHKAETGTLPDLHANPATTARVYDRSKEFKRRAM